MHDSDLRGLLSDVAAQLRYQRSLGLRGVDIDPQALLQRLSGPPQRDQGGAPLASATTAASPSLREGLTLEDVARQLGDCRRCRLHEKRTNIVFGVGDAHARLMFVGEAPGRDEDLQGEPFVGKAGELLDRMIEAMGLARHQVYIANVVKCRPPRNRDPEPDEVATCEPFLRQQIAAVGPEVLVTLGRYAAQTLLRDATPIGRMRGRWRSYAQIPLLPTFHPAYLLRNPGDKKLVWADLQLVMARLGLPRPTRQG